jgi:uncharacterized protein (DUF608 family)
MRIHNQVEHKSGIPLGGIGTGSIEILPDGYFHDWEIFNTGIWSPRQPMKCRGKQFDLDPDALSFYVRTALKNGSDDIKIRRLGMRTDQNELYSLGWVKNIQAIDYKAEFPIADLDYIDDSLPITIKSSIFSPFVPHDAKTSGTPGFYITFTVKNNTDHQVDVSLLSTLRNPLAFDAKDRKLSNSITHTDTTTSLTMRTTASLRCPTLLGSMSLSVTGGEASWIATDYKEFFKGYHTNGVDYRAFASVFHDFRNRGKLPNLGENASDPSKLMRMVPIDVNKKKELVNSFKSYAFSDFVVKRYLEIDPKILEDVGGINSLLDSVKHQLNRLAGLTRSHSNWGDGALCSSIILQPKEEKEVSFVLSWFFPNHLSKNGEIIGHMYENWFSDSEAVNKFLVSNYSGIRVKVRGFASNLYNTSYDSDLADAWSSQLTTLIKCTWWLKNSEFAVWEGLGCCGFHTTDITYQGSFNILALFPELQQKQMVMGARFQRDDGRVHHLFAPERGLERVDHGFDRVDMNPQFVLLTCRDYLWTNNKEYLNELWPHIVSAMENTLLLDADGDGLPDTDTRRNTYDCWNFFGTPSYIASLWLASLKAGILMAKAMGNKEYEDKWVAILQKGITAFEQKLWNGKYFSLWVDKKRRDECCMADQMDGEWFANLIGIGNCISKERIVDALKIIYQNNFTFENGLINAVYPEKQNPMFPTYCNIQATANWTGIEYSIASMMIDFGLVKEGINIVKSIHDRYLRSGRFFNHVECGDHYYRAMSSWAILLAVTGFKIDIPNETLSLSPIYSEKDMNAPWVASSGWGQFKISGKQFALSCLSGNISFRKFAIKLKKGIKITNSASIEINSKKIQASVSEKDGFQNFEFQNKISLTVGEILTITIN